MAGRISFTNTCNGKHGSHYTQTLTVNWGDYDIPNNKTYVWINYSRTRENSSYGNYGYANPSQISIDGSQVASATPYSAHNQYATQTLCTWEGYIYHNTDGTKSFNVSASFTSISSNLSGGSVSGTVQLPTIPRASTIVVPNANIGAGTTITINKYYDGFTTNLYWRVQGDNDWNYIANTSQTTYGWVVPTTLYQQTRNSKTIVCEFLARTLSGSTTIGDKTTTATFTATGNPVINSCTLVSTDSKTVNLVGSNRMIRYISTVQATVSASGTNSASISSIIVNKKTATNGVVSFPNADTYSYDVTVTDSRGYTATGNFRITWTDYIPLTLNATVVRNQPTDEKVKITFNGNYYNGSFRKSDDTYVANTLGVQYRSRVSGGSWGNWTTLTKSISGNTYSGTTILSGYNYTKQYEFQIWAGDQVKSQTITGINVSKGKPTFNWGEDFFNVNGTLKVNNNAILNILYPVGSIYMSATLNTAQKVHDALGGTWVAWGSGRVPVGVNTSDSNFNTVEKTGGETTHKLTNAELPKLSGSGQYKPYDAFSTSGIISGKSWDETKTFSAQAGLQSTATIYGFEINIGNDQAHNNLQPYITCFMWKRVS